MRVLARRCRSNEFASSIKGDSPRALPVFPTSSLLFVPPKRTLTVSELTGLLRDSIEEQFSDICLEGEAFQSPCPGSGHVYCTLKDKTSQIRAVLFRSSAVRLRFALQEGMQVIVRGRLTVYEPRGEYQIVLDTVEPKGIGALTDRI